jgi:hypothetical protein
MYDYPDFNDIPSWSWWNYREMITSVVFEGNINSIGDGTLAGLTNITSIEIPDTVTSLGVCTFVGCTNLEEVSIPDSITTIPNRTFHGCSSLSSIVLPESVTSLSDTAFLECNKLKSVVLNKDAYNPVTFEYLNISSDKIHYYYDISYSTNGHGSITGNTKSYGSDVLELTVTPDANYRVKNIILTTSEGSYEITPDKNGKYAYTMPNSEDDVTISASFITGSEYLASGTCGENLTWTLNGNGVLTISGYGDMYNYENSGETPWKDYRREEIKSVVFEGDITSIGSFAFFDCWILSDISIPDSVVSIGNFAFSGCFILDDITIPEGVVFIGAYAFSNCHKLDSIIIPNNVVSIGPVAFGSTAIESITIPNGVTTINKNVFSYCENLTEVNIPNSVTTIVEYAFSGCKNLKTIVIPDSVTSIGNNAFQNCTSLNSVVLNADAYNEAAFPGASSDIFHYYYNVSYTDDGHGTITGNTRTYGTDEVTLTVRPYSGYYIDKVTLIKGNQTIIIAPTDGVYKISMPDSDQSVTIKATFKPQGIGGQCGERLYWSFDGNSQLTIYGYGDMYDYGSTTAPWFNYNHLITTIVISEDVTSIGDRAFWEFNNLENVYFSNSVTRIGDYAFQHCVKLTEVNLPANLTSLGQSAFFNCFNITEIEIPEGVTEIKDHTFEACGGLTKVMIPDTVLTIGDYAFIGCGQLRTVYISNQTTSSDMSFSHGNVNFINYNSVSCLNEGFGTISIVSRDYDTGMVVLKLTPDSGYLIDGAFVHYFDDYWYDIIPETDFIEVDTTLGDSEVGCLFRPMTVTGQCGEDLYWTLDRYGTMTITGSGDMYDYSVYPDLSWFDFHRSVKAVVFDCNITSISESAFSDCARLTEITIPDTVTTIGNAAFSRCEKLSKVVILNGVTSVGAYAFSDCISLTSVDFPDSVVSIGDYVLYNSYNLESISYSNKAEINNQTFACAWGLCKVNCYNSVTCIPGDNGNIRIVSRNYDTGIVELRVEPDEDYIVSLLKLDYSNGEHALLTLEKGNTIFVDSNVADSIVYADFATGKGAGVCGDDIIWLLDDSGVFTLSGSGDMYDWNAVADVPWHDYADEIQTVVFDGNFTYIGSLSFYGCSGLISITIPESITSIGKNAFDGCSNLEYVVLNKDAYTNTAFPGASSNIFHYYYTVSYSNDGRGTITGKTKTYGSDEMTLTIRPYYDYVIDKVTLTKGNQTITITPVNGVYRLMMPDSDGPVSIKATFKGQSITGECGKNVRWTYDGIDKLTIFGYGDMYDFDYSSGHERPWRDYMTRIKTIEISDGVTSIGNEAFREFFELVNITLPDSITRIGDDAFFQCSSLTNITIPYSVTSIGDYAFGNCQRLSGITIPHSVESIGEYAFSNCHNLTELNILDGVTSIGERAFMQCGYLRKICLPDSVTTIGDYVFEGCGYLESIVLSNHTVISNATFMHIPSNCAVIQYNGITCQSNDYGMVFIDSRDYDTGIVKLWLIPKSECMIESVYIHDKNGYDDEFVPESDIVYVDTTLSNLEFFAAFRPLLVTGTCGENINWTLNESGKLTISGTGEMYDYTTDSEVPWFEFQRSITSVVFDGNITSISGFAFVYCSQLMSVEIPDSVTSIGICAFAQCPILSEVIIPDSVTSIGESAFEGCTDLRTISIPGGVNSIGEYAFNWCTNLQTVEIGSGVTSIGDYAFCYCVNLYSVDLPDSLTSIGEYAFCECSNLRTIDLPDNLTVIGSNAFYGCSNLRSITIPYSVQTLGSYSFGDCTKLNYVLINKNLGNGAFPKLSPGVFHYYYDVNYVNDGYGTISGKNVSFGGDVVEFTVIPQELFEVDEVTLTYGTKTVTITPDSDYKYRYTMPDSDEAVTVSATFNYSGELTISSQPQNFEGLIGETATFEVVAQGKDLTYQWQVYKSGVWKNTSLAGYNTSKLSVEVLSSRDGMKFHCVVTDSNGASITSEEAAITVSAGAINITSEPEDFSGPVGSVATFTVTAEGENLKYQWQVYKSGVWKNTSITGNNTSTLEAIITEGRNGMRFRCVIIDANGNTKTSGEAAIIVSSTDLIVTEPEDYSGPVGDTALFAVEANGTGLTYQWQVYKSGVWKNTSLTGNKSDVLEVGIIESRDGMKFRCVVTDANGKSVTSREATLTVEAVSAVTITSEPEDYDGLVGETAEFTVTAEGYGLIYQWQVYKSGVWKNTSITGNNTSTLEAVITEARNGMNFRCIVTDAEGNSVTSRTVSIRVLHGTGVLITSEPEDYSGPIGDTATFEITAAGNRLTYQWQVYKSGAWKNTSLPGNTTSSLDVEITAARDGMTFRCIVTDLSGNTATSDEVSIIVAESGESNVTITNQPENFTGAAGETALFEVVAEGEGLTYQWQVYKNGAWKNTSLAGNTTSSLAVEATTARNGMTFRCVVTGSNGATATSDEVTITVK